MYTVLISSLEMGRGNKTIGEKLMKAYIRNLTQKDKLPDYMLFYNTGVQLLDYDSEIINDIKILVDKGVKILLCGVCVEYFAIEVSVGEVSSMNIFIDIMSNSDKVITP